MIPGLTMSPKGRVPEDLASVFPTCPADHNSWSKVFKDLVLSAHLKFYMQMEHRSQLPECLSAPLKFLMASALSIFHLLFSTSEGLTPFASGYDSVLQSQRNKLMHTYNGNPVFNISEHLKDTHIRDVQDKISLRLHELISFTSNSQASTQTPSFTLSLSQTIAATQSSTKVHYTPTCPTHRIPSPSIITLESMIPNNNYIITDSDFFQRTYSRSLLLQFQHLQDDEAPHPIIQITTPNSITDLPQPKVRTGRRRVLSNSEGYKFYINKKAKNLPKIKEFNNSYTCRTPPPSGALGHPQK